ncbi:MAG: peptidoglycan editing factor PgeF [Halioglobus sp.]|nr:peptidoglycan editing factor PgeF [Halioglobus sp.]
MPRRPVEAHWIEPNWRGAPPGVTALSTTRCGGVSTAPWDSFNLGDHVGDDPADVSANRATLAAALPAGTAIQWLSQVHGASVVRAERGTRAPAADALWSEEPGVACAVLTADCLPVLLCTRRGDRVAAAHAGWRGLLGGVLEATVGALAGDPAQLLVWLGPAIGPGAFEVGCDVREQFMNLAPAARRPAVAACFAPHPARAGHWLADLYGLARQRLRSAGVKAIWGGQYCTFSQPRRFFSYRRDGQTGRMASLVLLQQGRSVHLK